MRFFEFRPLLVENKQYMGDLLSVLRYLQQNAINKDSDGRHQMVSVINQVKNAGSKTFSYNNFVEAFESNDAVKNLVANYNKKYITLNLDSSDGSQDTESGSEEDDEKLVSNMAKKAVDL